MGLAHPVLRRPAARPRRVYLRSKLADTPAYAALEKQSEQREKDGKNDGAGTEARTLLSIWPFLAVCMGLVIVWNVTNYMLTSYMPTYVSDTVPDEQGGGVSSTTSQVLQIVVMAVALGTIPLLGRLSDRVGRKPIAWVGVALLVVGSFPMVLLIQAGSVVGVFLGLLLMGLALICFSATMPSTLPALFPTKVRGAGLSVSFNVAVSLFAGTTSVVVGGLVGATGDLNWPAYYLIAAGVVGAVALHFLHEPNGRRMWGSAPAAGSEAEAHELIDAQDRSPARV